MKKVFTLLTLLVAMVTGAWADDPITVTWLPNNASTASATGTASVADVLTVSDLTVSTPVTFVSDLATYDSKKWGQFTSTNRPDKNKIATTDYITFTVTVGDGVTFKPTSATAYYVGIGTGNNAAGLYSTVQTSSVKSAADNSSNASTTTQKSLTLSGTYTEGQTVTFYIHIGQNNTTSNKGIAIRDVVLTGTYTKEDVVTYALTTTADPAAGGTITRSPNQAAYQASKSVTLTATPNYGYEFVNWTKDDVEVSTSASYAITTAAAAETYVAHFNALTTYALTVSANNDAYGTVAKSPDHDAYLVGEEVTLTATPKTGYGFVNWTKDDVEVSTNASYNITTTAAATEYVANFVPLYSITFNVDAENKGTSSTGFATQYANTSNKWTAPINYYVAKEGYTLTAWNDGENDYTPGTEYTLAGNITIAPVFTANTVTVADFTAETTVSWPFATSAGAPTLASEGNTQYYVKQATIAGNTVDVPIFVNTTTGYGISGKNGKFNNSANNSYAQVNNGTVFKIPAAQGMVVKYMTNQTTAVGNIGFTDNTSNLGGDGSALTTPTVISGDNKTISYTYTGTADYLYLVDKAGGKYPTGLSVTYPEKKTKYLAPTITVSDFNFAGKAYPVTITAAEGDLYVSTDGENYSAQTSPYEVNVTATTHFYAKATGVSFDDSDVVDENVINDDTKKYVAWVYESNYANAPGNYAIGTDAIHTALGTVYNVVNVDIKDYKSAITDEQKTALNGNLDDADLVVISEAAAGGSKAIIALKDLIGTVPMLSMKFFAYTYNSDASKNRWGWGTPKNADKAVVAITPASKNYKVLDGVTFNGDDIELFAYTNEQNHIQYVDSWEAEPTGDVVLATTSSKPAMHASTSQKYFALGLSCDDFTKYNTNAVTIVKNAAAMLIAGENLDAEVVKVTIGATGWSTFSSASALDFENATKADDASADLAAYMVTGAAGTAITKSEAVTDVPGNTGLLLNGTASAVYYVPVLASSATSTTGNLMKACVTETTVNYDDNNSLNYVLVNNSGTPEFQKIVSGTYSSATIPAGKAYLALTDDPGARALTLFDDMTTGINTVNGEGLKVQGSEVYNLNGQRVMNPTKGLYIVNGRKVVIK